MSKLRDLKAQILEDGVDLRIDAADAARIQEALAGQPLTDEDVKALVDLRGSARVVCPEFDRLFFPIFKNWLLADGTISLPEQFQLLRLLYGGGGVDDAERAFLKELRREVKECTPEFEELCRQALAR